MLAAQRAIEKGVPGAYVRWIMPYCLFGIRVDEADIPAISRLSDVEIATSGNLDAKYRCQECRKRTSVFVRSIGTALKPSCEHCNGRRLTRLISRVVVGRSGSSASDDFDERALADVDENDPRSVARWARRMRDQMGDELGPDFDQAIEQMEEGHFPEEGGDDD
jgi:DNA-directed RNA polymerase subunit RPC12/RpoP